MANGRFYNRKRRKEVLLYKKLRKNKINSLTLLKKLKLSVVFKGTITFTTNKVDVPFPFTEGILHNDVNQTMFEKNFTFICFYFFKDFPPYFFFLSHFFLGIDYSISLCQEHSMVKLADS